MQLLLFEYQEEERGNSGAVCMKIQFASFYNLTFVFAWHLWDKCVFKHKVLPAGAVAHVFHPQQRSLDEVVETEKRCVQVHQTTIEI